MNLTELFSHNEPIMHRHSPTDRPRNQSSKWGYAIAGGCALALAALVQLAFDGFDENALANMPSVIAKPYGAAGKLGITIPLALLGLGLIVRDGLANRAQISPAVDDDLEVGEPLEEEAVPAGSGRKIAARAGGFAGGRGNGTLVESEVSAGDGGQMMLASAKYMNHRIPRE